MRKAKVDISSITIDQAKRAMPIRERLQFLESLSFGRLTDWPVRLIIRGKTWYYYNDYGFKRTLQKGADMIAAHMPGTRFMTVGKGWEASRPLYISKRL